MWIQYNKEEGTEIYDDVIKCISALLSPPRVKTMWHIIKNIWTSLTRSGLKVENDFEIKEFIVEAKLNIDRDITILNTSNWVCSLLEKKTHTHTLCV